MYMTIVPQLRRNYHSKGISLQQTQE